MPVELKKTVFNTGPDDKLRAIDVYAPGEVKRASESAAPTSSSPATPLAAAAAAGMAALKDAMKSTDETPMIEELLGLGLSDGQLANVIEGFLPPAVDAAELLQTVSDLTLPDINGAVEAIGQVMPYSDVKAMSNSEMVQLIEEIVQPVRAGRVERVTEIEDEDLKVLIRGGEVINQVRYQSPEALEQTIASLPVTDIQRDYIRERSAKKAATQGNIDTTVSMVEGLTYSITPMESRYLIIELLKGYRKPKGVKKRMYVEEGEQFLSKLNGIDANWLYYTRGNEAIINLHTLRYASEDLLTVWSHHPTLGPTCLWLANLGAPEPKDSVQLMAERYPYMQVS